MSIILDIILNSYDVVVEAAPYVIFGTLFAGILKVFLQADKLPNFLAASSTGSAMKASLLGVPLPLCSCSVLPVAMELRRKGASRGATSSFLISTPQTGVDSIFLSFGLLNPVFAVARVIGSFMTGVLAGMIQNVLDRRVGDRVGEKLQEESAGSCGNTGASCCCSKPDDAPAPGTPLRRRLAAGQSYAFGDLLPSMSKYYVIGIVATGILMTFLPQGALDNYVGGGLFGMIAVCFVGILFYICASAATPFAAILVMKGMSPGTALVLLLAGPATSLASLAVVRAMLGTKGIVAYLSTIFVCAITLGLGLDAFYAATGFSAAVAAIGEAHEHVGPLAHAAALGLILYLSAFAMRSLFLKFRKPKSEGSEKQSGLSGGARVAKVQMEE